MTFEREETLVNGQYKLKLTSVSHDIRTNVTIDCCHLILFAATPPHKCAGNPCPSEYVLKNFCCYLRSIILLLMGLNQFNVVHQILMT